MRLCPGWSACKPQGGTYFDWAYGSDVVPLQAWRRDGDEVVTFTSGSSVGSTWLVDPGRPFVSFVRISLVLAVGVPLALVAVLSPLYFPIAVEFYAGYFLVIHCAALLSFAEALAVTVQGDRLPLSWALGGVALAMASGAGMFATAAAQPTGVRESGASNALQISCSGVSIFVLLLLPAAWRLAKARRGGASLRPSLLLAALMCWGSVPCTVASVLWVIFRTEELTAGGPRWVICLAAWTLIPWVLKAVSAKFLVGCAPSNPALVEMLFHFYVHLIFNVLGLELFVQTPVAVLGYSCATAGSLGLHLLRGTRCVLRCTGADERVARLVALTDGYCDMVGRVVAFVALLAAGALCSLGSVQGSELETRRSLILGKDVRRIASVRVVRRTVSTWPYVVATLGGLGIVVLGFLLFALSLPWLWRASARKASQVSPERVAELPETVLGQSLDELPPAGGNVAQEEGGFDGWLSQADVEGTVERQWLVLAALTSKSILWLMLCVVFVIIISSETLDVAEAALRSQRRPQQG